MQTPAVEKDKNVINKLALLLTVGLSSTVFANTIGELPTCTTQTLAYYTTNYGASSDGPGFGSSCSIGSLGYSDFYFKDITGFGTIAATDFNVVPDVATNSFSLIPISGGVLNRTWAEFERYFFSWYVDPPPVIAGDELQLDPPNAHVTAYKWGCPDSKFTNSAVTGANSITGASNLTASTFSCVAAIEGSFTPYFLTATTPTNLIDNVVIAPAVPRLDLRLVLDIGKGNVQNFNGILNPLTIVGGNSVPEPGTNAMIGVGIAALIAVAKKKLNR